MRLATFIASRRHRAACRRGARRRDRRASTPAPSSIASRPATARPPPAPTYPLAEVTLLAPVPRPRAIFGIGRNYAAHVAELGNELPDKPIVFLKLPTSSVAARAARSDRARGRRAARLRGRAGRRDRRRTARIAGYAVADDVCARDLQDAEDAVDARQGLRHLVPVGPVDHDRRRGARRRRRCASARGSTASCARTRNTARPDLRPAASSSTSSPRPARSSPATSSSPARPSGVGKALDPPRYLAARRRRAGRDRGPRGDRARRARP